jgi:hypothetical protein
MFFFQILTKSSLILLLVKLNLKMRILLFLVILVIVSAIVAWSSFSMAAASEEEDPSAVECGVSSYNPPHPAVTTAMKKKMKALKLKNGAGRQLQVKQATQWSINSKPPSHCLFILELRVIKRIVAKFVKY